MIIDHIRWSEGVSAMKAWITSGQIKVWFAEHRTTESIFSCFDFDGRSSLHLKVEETVVEGFEKPPVAFIGLFTGKKRMKTLVLLGGYLVQEQKQSTYNIEFPGLQKTNHLHESLTLAYFFLTLTLLFFPGENTGKMVVRVEA